MRCKITEQRIINYSTEMSHYGDYYSIELDINRCYHNRATDSLGVDWLLHSKWPIGIPASS